MAAGRVLLAVCCLLGQLPIARAPGAAPQLETWGGCQMMSSPHGWVRVLLPLNASTVGAGSLIVVSSKVGEEKDDTRRRIVLSIDGIEWLALENPRRVVQLPLPSSLQPGWHMVRVGAAEGEDDTSPPATEEAACVWFSITSPSITAAAETRAVEVVHPLTGAWFTSSSVTCPAAAQLTAPAGSTWVPCSFAIRVHTVNAEGGSSYTWVRVLVQKQLVWHGFVKQGMVQIPISLKREGWHAVAVEVCDTDFSGGIQTHDAGSQPQDFRCADPARAEVYVEALDAPEATARRRDLRMWDGISAQVSRATVSVLHPHHASVFGGSRRLDGSTGLRVLVRVEGVAVGAGAAAVALRLNGRLVPPALYADTNGSSAPASSCALAGWTHAACDGSLHWCCLWWVSQIDTIIPWERLRPGTHYLSAALVDGAGEGETDAAGRETSGVEMPAGHSGVVGFKIDRVRWPPLEWSSPDSRQQHATEHARSQHAGTEHARSQRAGTEQAHGQHANAPSHGPLPPSRAVERVHTLQGLLDEYARFHHHALASLQAAVRDARGAGSAAPWHAGVLPKVLLYTPPEYGWGNRLMDLSACLLWSLLSDRLLLVNWTRPVPLSQLIATKSPHAAATRRLLDVTGDGAAAELALFARLHSATFQAPDQLDLLFKEKRQAGAQGSFEGIAGEGAGGISCTLAADVVFVRFGLRALPRLLYSDTRLRSSLIFSLLPESYTDVLGEMLAELVHPSPPVCAALTSLTRLLPARNGPSRPDPHTRGHAPSGGEGASGRGECWQSTRADGVERSFRLLHTLITASHPASEPHETRDEGAQGDGDWWQGRAKAGRRDCVFLATDSLLLKETAAWRVQGGNVCVVTSPFPVVHTAGAGACGDSGECRALAANQSALEQVQVVCDAAADVVAEWWMLAAARRAWILTRGSSFGLSAAARGRFLSAAYPHPFCDVADATAAGAPPAWHVGRVYTVHEHKVRSFACVALPHLVLEHKVQRGIDCQTFDICALHPPHASPQVD